MKIEDISLDGGTLCLDFVNTVHNRKDVPLPDYLFKSTDLIAWGKKVGLLDAKKMKLLESYVNANPKKGEQFFKEAISFRELLFRMFYAVSEKKKITASDLEEYNSYLSHYLPLLRLKPENGAYKEFWDLPGDSLQQITAPVLHDAYELLLSDKLGRVKECPNCGWLFLDTTKNGRRRWCSMQSCGSSVKALEWYYRQKEEKKR